MGNPWRPISQNHHIRNFYPSFARNFHSKFMLATVSKSQKLYFVFE
ncbi:hypothetical protein LEP1GSC185_0118 [Leptospira licerasiae serovar Varillal str. VAR 010]|uniref:Uncharacterized protein n=1 Tax=Leptospira licerasiae str. MMD4847 TaxID=1049971 RepID=A0ABN0H9N7_9LEPT|nr:hypothetical protein LEP1GSC185_0118 [Leptospira licerasiae serovar Varillal str. VAR 010]EJZ42432.1 hypothetical protein LEP1GSC178_2477 [Leptospira licerasiae str. MMD4847]